MKFCTVVACRLGSRRQLGELGLRAFSNGSVSLNAAGHHLRDGVSHRLLDQQVLGPCFKVLVPGSSTGQVVASAPRPHGLSGALYSLHSFLDAPAPVAAKVPLVILGRGQGCLHHAYACLWEGLLEEEVPLLLPLPMLSMFMDASSSGWGMNEIWNLGQRPCTGTSKVIQCHHENHEKMSKIEMTIYFIYKFFFF